MFTFWKETKTRDDPFYRFQTDTTKIHQKMKRSKKFTLTGIGVNCKLWIYRSSFLTPQMARVAFKNLSSTKVRRRKKRKASSIS